MKYAAVAVAVFSGLVSASPVDGQARAATSVDVSNFKVSCEGNTCNYSANLNLIPENYSVSCTHTTTGATVPSPTTGYWTCSDSQVWIRVNDIPTQRAYRIVIQDVRGGGPATLFQYFSPQENWPEKKRYTGPSSFTATTGNAVPVS